LNDWAKAGEAALITASAASSANFDLFIMTNLLVIQQKRHVAVIAVGEEMGPPSALLIGEWSNRLSTKDE
jgi:hypothetical protein